MKTPLSWTWGEDGFIPSAGLPFSDRGFRFGMAFFESLAIRHGQAEFLEPHLARLREACRSQNWCIEGLDLTRAGDAIAALCGSEPVFARLYLTAGEGAPSAPVTHPRLHLYAEPRNSTPPAPYSLIAHPEPHLPLFGGLKTANYWANAAHYTAALTARADEALVFSPSGELISACMANAFLKIGDQWITPPATSGARQGVIREWVMQRRNVIERVITAPELAEANACFLTSSWHGVIPVGTLNSRPLETTFAEDLRSEFP